MSPDRDRFRSPLSARVAGALLALLLSATERWLWRGQGPPATPGRIPETGWLTVLPPPWESEPDDVPVPTRPERPRAASLPEAPWWQLAWQERTEGLAAATVTAPAGPDSTALLLGRLGLAPDLAARARPDSVLAARLIWLSRREGYLPQEVRPWLQALGRAEAYRALVSRAAEMYDEFLAQEIITTD